MFTPYNMCTAASTTCGFKKSYQQERQFGTILRRIRIPPILIFFAKSTWIYLCVSYRVEFLKNKQALLLYRRTFMPIQTVKMYHRIYVPLISAMQMLLMPHMNVVYICPFQVNLRPTTRPKNQQIAKGIKVRSP